MNLENSKWHKFESNLPLIIDNEVILPGKMHTVRINAGKIPSDNRINVHAHIFSSNVPGPVVLLLGGVHGDEINGIEIIRRSIEEDQFEKLKCGTLIVIPLLNVFGFINFSRDLSDGKDVNRSFPGHLNGSLASRIARIITKKILPLIDIAIDFHTGGGARYNYPHVRFHPGDKIASQLAKWFGTEYILEQGYIAKSFRKVANEMGVPAIVFEGGEPIRLDNHAINAGMTGIRNILNALGMLDCGNGGHKLALTITKTTWIRAQMPGIFIHKIKSGQWVEKGTIMGYIKDPYGTKSNEVKTRYSGIILGHNNSSIVNLGDALFHIGYEFREQIQNTNVHGF